MLLVLFSLIIIESVWRALNVFFDIIYGHFRDWLDEFDYMFTVIYKTISNP